MQASVWQCLFTILRSVPRLECRGIWRSDAMKLDILRRKIAVAVLMLAPLAALAPVAPTPAAAAANPIVIENQQEGTGAWFLGPQQGDDGTAQTKGYATARSVLQNQSRTPYVTGNPA